MKALFMATAVAATLLVPHAFAQTRSFEGFSLGLNVNSATISNEFNAAGTSAKFGETAQNASFQAEYGFPATGIFNIGLGITYALSELKAGSATLGGVNYELKEKDAYSLFVEPGFTLSDTTMAYGKVAYLGMRGETRLSTGTTQRDDFFGWGYGIGIRALMHKNLYLQAEILQNNYNERSANGLTIKPSATMGSIGIGYKF